MFAGYKSLTQQADSSLKNAGLMLFFANGQSIVFGKTIVITTVAINWKL
jgi:hypothetical protein